jgi:molecular chaperone GrpE
MAEEKHAPTQGAAPQRQEESTTPGNGTATADGPQVLSTEELEALRGRAAERDQYLDMARRTQADFENYRRRSQRDREQERQMMLAAIVRDILPVLDNLELALHAAQQAGETGPLAQGVKMVQAQFLDVLRRNGITVIEALGQPFDPNHHEAVAQLPSTGHPANTVVQILAPGFLLDDRVLRPAKVVVSAAP